MVQNESINNSKETECKDVDWIYLAQDDSTGVI
jgi:hypothetical protein